MSAPARTAPANTLKAGGLDPLRWAWSLLTNVKFALFLVGLAAFAGLLGVVIPQMPGPMRENAAARSAWLALQRDDFGVLTGPMDRIGLFEVFHTAWFNGLWILIIVAVTVCTVSRFRPTWRSVQRPPKLVSEAYFEHAHHRASFTHAGGVDAIERELRKRHYSVERVKDGDGAAYLFAERFRWSQYGTFLSHLALLMLLVGGLLTRFAGFERTLALAETMPGAPLFSQPGQGQIFVTMLDAQRGFDADGNIVDYRSRLEVRRGDTVVTCTSTVNDPCHAFGYRFHQAAFFDDVGRLRVEAADGRILYNGVLDFEDKRTFVPHIRITDAAGTVLYDAPVPQGATYPGTSDARSDDVAIGSLVDPASDGGGLSRYALAWQVVDGKMHVGFGAQASPSIELPEGDAIAVEQYEVTFVRPEPIPALRVDDMPGALDDSGATVQMPTDSRGQPYLYVSGIATENQVLPVGQPVETATHRYLFENRVEGAGIDVRRDPGDTFIWAAVAMAIVGLSITFYVPRRRLWVKVTRERTQIAGIAEKTTRLGRELRLMGADLGSADALLPGDLDRER